MTRSRSPYPVTWIQVKPSRYMYMYHSMLCYAMLCHHGGNFQIMYIRCCYTISFVIWLTQQGCLTSKLGLSIFHSIGMCRTWWFLAVLRSLFPFSPLYTLSFHLFPPTSLPSSLTSSCHLFLGLPLSLVSEFICNIFFGKSIFFLPFSVHAQTSVIYLTLLSLLQWVF